MDERILEILRIQTAAIKTINEALLVLTAAVNLLAQQKNTATEEPSLFKRVFG